MRRALVSVSDKNDLVPFVKGLVENDFEIISTGGTKKVLDEAGIKTISVEDVTGFPEILDGRVKTHIFTEVCSDVEMFPNTLRR